MAGQDQAKDVLEREETCLGFPNTVNFQLVIILHSVLHSAKSLVSVPYREIEHN